MTILIYILIYSVGTVIALLIICAIVPSLRWAIYGNDDEGPYGMYEHTWWGAVKWWRRNPLHNLFWHVLNWPGGPFITWGKKTGYNGYIGFRPPEGVFGFRPWGFG